MINDNWKITQPKPNRSARDGLGDLRSLSNLTALQVEFWTGQKLHPDRPLFNCVDTFTIKGSIKLDHFRAAFQTLIDKTDALRTIFEERDGIPWQRILDNLAYEIEYLDFSHESSPRNAFDAWMQYRTNAPIDIRKRSFDSALAKLSEDQFVWYLNIHHIAVDGQSFYVIFHRMQALYRRSLEGSLDDHITFPLFQDYVAAEQSYRRSPQYLVDQEYWKTKRAETQPLKFYGRLPAGRPAPVRRVDCDLGVERTKKLKALTRQEQFVGKTSNIALLNMLGGVLAAYLYRVTGNQHLSVGIPFSNRRSQVLKETVGLLMQIAPLNITIEEADTFISLVKKFQAESADTARHCRYTITNHQNSLYDVIYNFHTGSFDTFSGIPAQENVIHSTNDRYSFSLHVRYPEAETLLLQFDFHPDVFDEAQQTRASEHFFCLLDAFLDNPEEQIGKPRVVSPTEKQHVVAGFNRSAVAFSEQPLVHRLFEAQVERSPDAVAVTFPSRGECEPETEELTYRELNRRANRLAHYLISIGVGPEVLVGICMERSLEMVIGLLGILKAGGAYVPLDPDYPRERLVCMLEDSAVTVLITQERMTARLPTHGVKVVCLDTDAPAIAQQTDENPTKGVLAENLAYVIFTSGSTGRPKGAMNTHRGVCNRLLWMQQAYRLGAADRVLQKTPFSFDVSVWEFFWPLMTGACIVIARPGGHKDSSYLANVIANQKITTIHFVPSMLQTFLDESTSRNSCASLKRVICSGEALSVELQERFFNSLSARLHNLYGPTEAAVDVTAWDCKRDPAASAIPIGRPIANIQIYLVDSYLQPVPIGVVGELHIGGVGVGRGYVKRADLTAEKFIPDPFSDSPGARLYKTGDLAWYRPDGAIEFLGRIDHQVKIRGFRIELGEIEAVLARHPSVADAVVSVHQVSDDKRLVGYVIPRTGQAPTAPELREFLRAELPEYMVPSGFVFLDSLPLTPNGKINRQALPVANLSRPELNESFIAPRNAVEEAVARIWSEVLELDDVGVDDNFFQLGGHSLLAIKIIGRLQNLFQIEIPLKILFEKPTVARLAEQIVAEFQNA